MQTAPKGSQRSFGKVVPTTGQPILHHQFTGTTKQPPQPLPTPTGSSPYHLSLDQVLPAATMQNIQTAGRLVFHIVGDVGGVKAPQSQEIVAMHMIQDLSVPDLSARPVFFYCLGDVVYYYGQAGDYYSQFYEPYMHYDAPIFAFPVIMMVTLTHQIRQSLRLLLSLKISAQQIRTFRVKQEIAGAMR